MSERLRVRRAPARTDAAAGSAPTAVSTTTPAARAAPVWGAAAGPVFTLGNVQLKPEIGEPGDAFEQEADAVSARVSTGLTVQAAGISRIGAGGVRAAPQRMPLLHAIQRDSVDDEDSVQAQTLDEEDAVQLASVDTEEDAVQLAPLDTEDDVVQASIVGEEHDAVASSIVGESDDGGPSSAVGRDDETVQAATIEGEDDVVQAAAMEEENDVVQPAGLGPAPMQQAAADAIRSPGAGSPLPSSTRGTLESRMGVDLGHVRVHQGSDAAHATAALGARAFTHGSDIWLGRDETAGDVSLMAHEATHVVQQGAAVRRQPEAQRAAAGHDSVQRRPAGTGGVVQRLIPNWILEELASFARHIPGWTLFTVIIGFNPLTRTSVPRTATTLLEGFMGLVPFGTYIFDALRDRGILQDAFAWVEGELSRLDLSLSRIERTIEAAWDDVSIVRGFDYNMGVLRRHFGGLYNDVESFALSLVSRVVEMIKEAAISVAEGLLAENRAWALIKKILGRDPLRDEPVEATPTEILEDFLLLIDKEQHLEQMRERGTLEETAEWLAAQIGTFLSLLGELRGLITRAWDAIQPQNLPNLLDNLQALATDVGGFLQRVWDFAVNVAVEVLEFIKRALLEWLAGFADEVPGFHLITVILGRNPFTGEDVPRSAENLIRGFITLLPNGNAIYARLAESGTVAGAAARIEGALQALGISWEFVVGLFTGIWDALSIEDVIRPIETFTRIVDQFGEPISRLFAFINVVLREMLFLILEMMNFPSDLIGSIVSNAVQAIEDVKRDPIGFLQNMLAAVRLGFSNFFDNILTHLIAGLADWLFRGLRSAGIEPPADLSFASVLDFVLQILGISMERIWQKLAERIGQENVDRIRGAIDRLVGIWNFVRDVQQRGIAAIWEYIEGQLSNLWNMVLEKAKEWIMERIIARAIQWLLSLLDATGIMPVINTFMAFFNAVQSAIEYLRDILAIINDYVSTIAAVARGEIAPGAQKLETGLANAIPVAIGFLANQFGLGNIGEKIQEIVGGLRELVDQALDWLIDRAVSTVQSVLSMLGLGGAVEDSSAQPGDTEGALPQEEFVAGEEEHRIWIRYENGRYGAVISSETKEIDAFLTIAENNPAIPDERKEEIPRARILSLRLNQLLGDLTVPGVSEGQREALVRQIDTHETLLAQIIQRLLLRVPIGDIDERYRLEGFVATYAALQNLQTWDLMTPDHQPQNRLLEHAAGLPEFQDPFHRRLREVADRRSALGICINLHFNRHRRTRTYGSGIAAAVGQINSQLAAAGPDMDERRRRVVGVLRSEMNLDIQVVESIVGASNTDPVWSDIHTAVPDPAQHNEVIDGVRSRILAGESRVRDRNEAYFAQYLRS